MITRSTVIMNYKYAIQTTEVLPSELIVDARNPSHYIPAYDKIKDFSDTSVLEKILTSLYAQLVEKSTESLLEFLEMVNTTANLHLQPSVVTTHITLPQFTENDCLQIKPRISCVVDGCEISIPLTLSSIFYNKGNVIYGLHCDENGNVSVLKQSAVYVPYKIERSVEKAYLEGFDILTCEIAGENVILKLNDSPCHSTLTKIYTRHFDKFLNVAVIDDFDPTRCQVPSVQQSTTGTKLDRAFDVLPNTCFISFGTRAVEGMNNQQILNSFLKNFKVAEFFQKDDKQTSSVSKVDNVETIPYYYDDKLLSSIGCLLFKTECGFEILTTVSNHTCSKSLAFDTGCSFTVDVDQQNHINQLNEEIVCNENALQEYKTFLSKLIVDYNANESNITNFPVSDIKDRLNNGLSNIVNYASLLNTSTAQLEAAFTVLTNLTKVILKGTLQSTNSWSIDSKLSHGFALTTSRGVAQIGNLMSLFITDLTNPDLLDNINDVFSQLESILEQHFQYGSTLLKEEDAKATKIVYTMENVWTSDANALLLKPKVISSPLLVEILGVTVDAMQFARVPKYTDSCGNTRVKPVNFDANVSTISSFLTSYKSILVTSIQDILNDPTYKLSEQIRLEVGDYMRLVKILASYELLFSNRAELLTSISDVKSFIVECETKSDFLQHVGDLLVDGVSFNVNDDQPIVYRKGNDNTVIPSSDYLSYSNCLNQNFQDRLNCIKELYRMNSLSQFSVTPQIESEFTDFESVKMNLTSEFSYVEKLFHGIPIRIPLGTSLSDFFVDDRMRDDVHAHLFRDHWTSPVAIVMAFDMQAIHNIMGSEGAFATSYGDCEEFVQTYLDIFPDTCHDDFSTDDFASFLYESISYEHAPINLFWDLFSNEHVMSGFVLTIENEFLLLWKNHLKSFESMTKTLCARLERLNSFSGDFSGVENVVISEKDGIYTLEEIIIDDVSQDTNYNFVTALGCRVFTQPQIEALDVALQIKPLKSFIYDFLLAAEMTILLPPFASHYANLCNLRLSNEPKEARTQDFAFLDSAVAQQNLSATNPSTSILVDHITLDGTKVTDTSQLHISANTFEQKS